MGIVGRGTLLIAISVLCAAAFGVNCATTTGRGPLSDNITAEQAAVLSEPEPSVPNVTIEVNIPATEMTVYENGAPKFVKPVAIGSGVYPTPEQESSVKRIEWNPWWYPPPGAKWAAGAKPTPPGPGNPLGLVKMAISDAILFHGTNKEHTVGTPASHGCMRMFNKDAAEVAWYLQSLFTEKKDPKLREVYSKNRKTTYVVKLDHEVPVRLIYKPIVVKEGSIFLYPDYYGRLPQERKTLLLNELERNGIDASEINFALLDSFMKPWPRKALEIPISQVMGTAIASDATIDRNAKQSREPARSKHDKKIFCQRGEKGERLCASLEFNQ